MGGKKGGSMPPPPPPPPQERDPEAQKAAAAARMAGRKRKGRGASILVGESERTETLGKTGETAAEPAKATTLG